MGRGFSFIAALCLVSCTKPPAMPRLPASDPVRMDRFILRDGLSVRDVRELFHAVNRDGRLDALRPYLLDASDESLRDLGQIAERHLYTEVYSEEGFLKLLERRAATRSFSDFSQRVHAWLAERDGTGERRALLAALRLPQGPALVLRDLGFLDVRWAEATARARDSAEASYRETRHWPEAPALDTEAAVADLTRWLPQESIDGILHRLDDDSFGVPAMNALREAQAQRGTPAFEGFGYGLARLLRTPHHEETPADGSRLEAMLRLAKGLDARPDGLFRIAQEALRAQPDLARNFATLFQPDLAVAVDGILRDSLQRPRPEGGSYDRRFWIPADPARPTAEESTALFIGLRAGVEGITGPARTETARDYVLGNLTLFTNTYALTKWAQAAVASNATTLAALRPEDRFPSLLWAPTTRLRVPALTVNLAERRDGEYRLAAAVQRDFQALGLGTFAEGLDAVIRRDGFGNWLYRFTAADAVSFREAMTAAVRVCQGVRAFGDSAVYLRDLIYRLSHDDPAAPVVVGELENTANLMDAVHHGLQALGPQGWRRARHLLFDRFRLADPNETSTRDLLLSLYRGNAPLQTRVTELFDRLPALVDFDTPEAGVDSPFALYHRIVLWVPGPQVHSLTALLSFADDSRLLALPTVRALVAAGKPLSRLTHFFGAFSAGDAAVFRVPFAQAIAGDGARLHREALLAWLRAEPHGAAALLGRLSRGDVPDLLAPDFLSLAERAWLRRFVERGELARLATFLRQHGSAARLAQLAGELRALSRSGYLHDAFALLAQVRNERVQELARIFLAWDRSGELTALLDTAESLLHE